MKVSKLGRYHWARVEWMFQSVEGWEEAREPVGLRRSLRRVLKPESSSTLWER